LCATNVFSLQSLHSPLPLLTQSTENELTAKKRAPSKPHTLVSREYTCEANLLPLRSIDKFTFVKANSSLSKFASSQSRRIGDSTAKTHQECLAQHQHVRQCRTRTCLRPHHCVYHSNEKRGGMGMESGGDRALALVVDSSTLPHHQTWIITVSAELLR